MADQLLTIDGSHGEGGGQILRTALGLSAVCGRPVRIENIRANRARPGLAAQHLTAVRAAAAVCRARVGGDDLASRLLTFEPRVPPLAAAYRFDVAAARAGGSAGSAPLVLQTVLVPLAFASGASSVVVEGGTHLPKAPFIDFIDQVWRPALAAMGIAAELWLDRPGFYPVGRGVVRASVRGLGSEARLRPLVRIERGALRRIGGRALTANLPDHVAARMAETAARALEPAGVPVDIDVHRAGAACPGAALFLVADYEGARTGASALGRRGRPAEDLAREAAHALLACHRSGAAVDAHLADQILVPAALADGPSAFTVERVTPHLVTNAWVIESFGLARVEIERPLQPPAVVLVHPRDPRPGR